MWCLVTSVLRDLLSTFTLEDVTLNLKNTHQKGEILLGRTL